MPHPSILIAFGEYGIHILRNFLASAATRGALAWDEEVAVGAVNERRLQALSLFWAPDGIGPRDANAGAGNAFENDYELMEDLFSQIERLEGSFDEIRKRLEEGVEREKRRLLDPRRHGESNLPGLDVYIIAHPTSPDMIGLIRNLTEPAMDKLSSDRSFETAQSSTKLNFIHILDFDGYWEPRMERVRATLRRMIDEGSEAISRGKPAAGRVYVFDSATASGPRRLISRQQEAVLLLEFLLLENIRSHPTGKVFFERQHAGLSPLCSVGIRVMERSSGLLRRLAAAAFAHGWLDYLASTQRIEAQEPPFDELVKPFRGESLSRMIGEPELRASAASEIAQLEHALLALPPDDEKWTERLRQCAEHGTEAAIQRLSRRSGARSADLSRVALKRFLVEIEPTITAALQERNSALTIGTVIAELQSLENEFAAASAAAKPAGPAAAPAEAPFIEAGRMQQEYLLHRSRQVQTSAMKSKLWPRVAVVFAIAFSPMLLRGVAVDPINGAVPPWVLAPVCAATLGLAFWFLGRRSMQPSLDRTAERARQFYTDPEQGRLSERVRQIVRAASVAGRIETYTDLLVHGLKQYALTAIADEFHRVRLALIKRRDEVLWLRAQVGEFLRSCQVDDRDYPPRFEDGRSLSDVRFSLEGTEDLAAVAKSLPRMPDRFRDQISSRKLFDSWSMEYSSIFLHPLQFFDQLSESFADESEVNESELRRRSTQITGFIQGDAKGVPVCFHWLVTDGLPILESGCLIPEMWQNRQSINTALSVSGFGQHKITSPGTERLYLLHSLMGIPSELLIRTGDWISSETV